MTRSILSRVISPSLSPNTEYDDVLRAIQALCMPLSWRFGQGPAKVESWFRQYTGSSCAITFNSGRSALLALLKAFDVGKGDEVIVQAFTCVAVPNSVRWAGATPIYADIDLTYNLDPRDIEKKITPKTRAIIVQHTFGIPADIKKIIDIAAAHKLIVIEDCAHALGTTVEGKKLGTFGDAAFFSFGRDKIVSSVFGGLAVIGSHHREQIASLKAYHKKLAYPSFVWIFQQIFHPVICSLVLPWYRLTLGKVLLVVCQRLHLLSFPVYPQEKQGEQPKDFPTKYPNALAFLLLGQLKKIYRYNTQRNNAAEYYQKNLGLNRRITVPPQKEGSVYLRFPLLVDDPKKMIEKGKREGILLGNWYHHTIDPAGVNFKIIGYVPGSCPKAEEASLHALNLPTRVSLNDAQSVVNLLKA